MITTKQELMTIINNVAPGLAEELEIEKELGKIVDRIRESNCYAYQKYLVSFHPSSGIMLEVTMEYKGEEQKLYEQVIEDAFQRIGNDGITIDFDDWVTSSVCTTQIKRKEGKNHAE